MSTQGWGLEGIEQKTLTDSEARELIKNLSRWETDKMKIDFSTELLSLSGEPIKENIQDESGIKKVPLQLWKVCTDSLLAVFQDERNVTGEDKVKRWKLAQKIHEAKEVDLESEEISLIKSLIAKSYSPAIVGPAFQLLEGKPQNGSSDSKE